MTVLLLAMIQGALTPAPASLTTGEILDRMVQAETQRQAAFSGYTGVRRYRFENKKTGKRAEVMVRITCDPNGAKTFAVTSESGSGFVRNHIIRKMIDAEADASIKGEHEQTRILPQNYTFMLIGTEEAAGKTAYVLEIVPKSKSQYTVRGRIWVDAEDFAITRLEGSPAKNPSFWIRSVKVVHRYDRFGRFWLPVSNQSRADVRIFGATDVGIEYSDYLITEAPGKLERTSSESRAGADR